VSASRRASVGKKKDTAAVRTAEIAIARRGDRARR
jgi:hypothetical protein